MTLSAALAPALFTLFSFGNWALAQTPAASPKAADAAPAQTAVVKPPPVEFIKTKIWCSSRYESTFTDKKTGEKRIDKVDGPTSESVRSTWKQGDVEYRTSESKAFDDDGVTVSNEGRSMSVFTSKEENGLIVETMKVRTFSLALGGSHFYSETGTSMLDRAAEYVATYRIEGDKRILVKSLTDGKEDPAIESYEIITQISPTRKLLISFEGPRTEIVESGKYETSESKMTCLLEQIP